jgi:hypothetical protein
MFRGSVKSTGYPLHSPVSPSLPLPCFTVWHHISTGLYASNPFATGQQKEMWSEPQSGRFTNGKEPQPAIEEAGWAPGPVWTVRSIWPTQGWDPQPVQP